MVRARLEDLPRRYWDQINKQLAGDRPMKPADLAPKIVTKPPTRKMTKTEQQFQLRLITLYGRESVHYEPITFRLENGHRYTPDFVVRHGSGLVLYEVKGSYKLHSHGRARLAFDQARVEWPIWTWVWAEKQKDGTWKES